MKQTGSFASKIYKIPRFLYFEKKLRKNQLDLFKHMGRHTFRTVFCAFHNCSIPHKVCRIQFQASRSNRFRAFEQHKVAGKKSSIVIGFS